MAYNESLANRTREIIARTHDNIEEKKMFGGLCFMVDDKMLCGTHIDKKSGQNFLLCRIGEKAYESVIERNDCIPMEFTGKTMKGYVFVLEAGFKNKKDLSYWLQLCLDHNPVAKSSKRK